MTADEQYHQIPFLVLPRQALILAVAPLVRRSKIAASA